MALSLSLSLSLCLLVSCLCARRHALSILHKPHVYTCKYMYMHIPVCIHTYIYIYIYTHTHSLSLSLEPCIQRLFYVLRSCDCLDTDAYLGEDDLSTSIAAAVVKDRDLPERGSGPGAILSKAIDVYIHVYIES